MATEGFDDGTDHHFGPFGGRVTQEPAVVRTLDAALRRTGLATGVALAAPARRCRPALHHTAQGGAKPLELLRRETERAPRGTLERLNQIGRPIGSVAGESRIEPHHVHQRLGVLALPDGQTERDPVAPAARTAGPIEVARSGGEKWLRVAREVDAAALREAELVAVLEQIGQPELEPELVEIGVAARGDGAHQVERPVAFLPPAME